MDDNLSEQKKEELSELLRKLESRTELEACAVVSKEGLRIACAVGADLDADVYSAASAALVNLGETTLRQLRHGNLIEIIVRGDDGYTILTSAGPGFMIVGSCRNMSRLGYYLALLHRFSAKIAETLGIAIETPKPVVAARPAPIPAIAGPTAASLLETTKAPMRPPVKTPTPAPRQPPQPTTIKTPPLSQVKGEPMRKDVISEALEILTPSEEPETIEIMEPDSISLPKAEPKEVPAPIPIEEEPELIPMDEEPGSIPLKKPAVATESVNKGALFEALQALGTEKTPTPPPATRPAPSPPVPAARSVPAPKADTKALMNALKPQPTAKPEPPKSRPAPFVPQQPAAKPKTEPAKAPFTAKPAPSKGEAADDDLFKISDKEAVLEALKVLGWEEPEDKGSKK